MSVFLIREMSAGNEIASYKVLTRLFLVGRVWGQGGAQLVAALKRAGRGFIEEAGRSGGSHGGVTRVRSPQSGCNV